MVHNTWVIDVIADLTDSGKLRSLARNGFIDRGRGAIYLNLQHERENLYYLCRAVWKHFDLDEPRRVAVLSAIDTYQPLSQAIVVAFSNLGDQEEVTTCLIKLS